ncbi:hypothetical protein HT136_19020 [Novosphingobium profundi]|uniref:c-type cytochrome n=1 Tax=Novosphingobium profundi TaxID=1774954 RepID=UPI001BDAAD2F|nr:c-type cytochrome [Novosphingobium profundi]MBT0670463.1 hypothetical protein [Novosphingobium profundi]
MARGILVGCGLWAILASVACTQKPSAGAGGQVDSTPEITRTEVKYQPPSPQLKTLMADHACDNCHAIDYKRLGPAFADVAAVYEGADAQARAALVEHIQKGISGRWGTMPMPPQPTVTKEDAANFERLILRLAPAQASGPG